MALLKIECLVNPMKETKLTTDEKVKSGRLLHCRSPKHATSNGICLNDEDYLNEGWKRQNKAMMIGERKKEDKGLIPLEKLLPMPTALPDDDDKEDEDEEDEEGGSISVAMLHPMPIDPGFLCKKHRTEGSFPRESIFSRENLAFLFPININIKTEPTTHQNLSL